MDMVEGHTSQTALMQTQGLQNGANETDFHDGNRQNTFFEHFVVVLCLISLNCKSVQSAPLPVIPIQTPIQHPMKCGQLNSNSTSGIERNPTPNF